MDKGKNFSKYFYLLFTLIALAAVILVLNKYIFQKDELINKLTPDTPLTTNKIFKYKLSDFYKNDTVLLALTDSIFSGLTDEQKAGQMIVTSTGTLGKPFNYVEGLVKNKKAGGVLLLGGSKESFKQQVAGLKNTAKSSGSLPLIFSADAEPSLINLKISGLKHFNPTNTIKTTGESIQTARDIDSILKEIGFNQNYAPVCDFPYNKEIIGNRSFGSNEAELKKLSASFIESAQSDNIIATAKHFPGHGNVKGDSHKGLVYIDGGLKEIDVFKHAIDIGVISIMVGHIAIRNNEKYNTNGLPSTLSKNIITGLLKNELGFKGIIITDGMNMGALSGFETPSFKAALAGCDMILMPSDETKLINSITAEMKTNPEFAGQVEESVKKIIRLKICLGLI